MLAPVMNMESLDPSVCIFTQLLQGWKREQASEKYKGELGPAAVMKKRE